jgi:hypothetical protein
MLRHTLVALALLAVATVTTRAQIYPQDESLDAAAYASLGIPSADEPWSVDDYRAAIAVLDSIAKATPNALPQYGSPRSGALFARIVAINNAHGVDPSLTDDARLDSVVLLTQEFNGLLGVYTQAGAQGMVFDNELAELLGYALSTADSIAAMVTRVIVAGGQGEILKDTAHESLTQMRSGLAMTAVGAVRMLGVMEPLTTSALRLDARRRLARHIGAHVPAIATLLTPGGRGEVRAQLGRVLGVEKDAEVRGILKNVDKTLSKSARTSKAGRKKSKRN